MRAREAIREYGLLSGVCTFGAFVLIGCIILGATS